MYENDGFHPYEDNNDAQNRYEAQSSETSGNQWQQPLYQMPQQPEHTQPKKKHTAGRVVALALCCSLLGGAVGAGAMAIGTSMTGTSGGSRSSSTSTILQGDRPTSAINVSKIDTSKEMTAAEVYAANVNSTVGITTSITTNYWGYQTTAAASGSGFILTADGYILTNYHVIENSDSVKVTMYDGTSYDATIVGYAGKLEPGGLLERVKEAKTVILVSPRLELLRRIASGDDGDPLSHLLVRAILWQKDVRVYLDYEPPRFRRNTFLADTAEAIDTLRQMAVTVCPYFAVAPQEPEGTDLVTEADVLDAAKTESKTIRCRSGAIITPAARDALAATDVILRYEGETTHAAS